MRQRLSQRVLQPNIQLRERLGNGAHRAGLHAVEVPLERFELGQHAAHPVKVVELDGLLRIAAIPPLHFSAPVRASEARQYR